MAGSLTRFLTAERNRYFILGGLLLILLFFVILLFFLLRFQPTTLISPVSSPGPISSVYGPAERPFERPTGVAVGPGGNVFIADPTGGRVVVYDKKGNLVSSFGDNKKDSEKLAFPVYVAIDKRGRVYVSDVDLRRLRVYSENGDFLGDIFPGRKSDFAWTPLALAFDAEGNLYVTDVSKHRVIVLKPDREPKLVFGQRGSNDGQLLFPNGIAVDGDGRIYVADSNNNRVQVFTKDGKFLTKTPVRGLPRGLAIDKNQRLYVTSVLEHNIGVYAIDNGELRRIFVLGEEGEASSQFQFPNDVAVNDDGELFIADRGNGRLQVWSY